MTVPPVDTVMGRLAIDEVFVRYDGPRLFACSNESGFRYLGLFVDDDEESEIYLYAPVSSARLAAIRSGQMAVREAFANPSDGGVFVVRSVSGDGRAGWVLASELPLDWLPDTDARLRLPTATQRSLDETSLARDARAIGRTLAAFELDTPWTTTEFPLRAAGDFMRLVQESVNALGQVVRQKPTNRGAVQHDVAEDAELSLYDLQAASFAVVVASSPRTTLFREPLVEQSLEVMLNVIRAAGSEEVLIRTLEGFHPRALAKYKDLLEELEDVGSGLTALVAEPERPLQRAELTRDDVRLSLQVVRRSMGAEVTELSVFARLVGVNERTNTFELVDESLERRMRGKVAPNARGQIEGLTIGRSYNARVEEEKEVIAVSGEVRHKFKLLAISPGDGTII